MKMSEAYWMLGLVALIAVFVAPTGAMVPTVVGSIILWGVILFAVYCDMQNAKEQRKKNNDSNR
jgi:Flp pilus assembly protein TadB